MPSSKPILDLFSTLSSTVVPPRASTDTSKPTSAPPSNPWLYTSGDQTERSGEMDVASSRSLLGLRDWLKLWVLSSGLCSRQIDLGCRDLTMEEVFAKTPSTRFISAKRSRSSAPVNSLDGSDAPKVTESETYMLVKRPEASLTDAERECLTASRYLSVLKYTLQTPCGCWPRRDQNWRSRLKTHSLVFHDFHYGEVTDSITCTPHRICITTPLYKAHAPCNNAHAPNCHSSMSVSLVMPEQSAQISPRLRVMVKVLCVPSALVTHCYRIKTRKRRKTVRTHAAPHTRLYPLPSMSKHVHDPCPTQSGNHAERQLSNGYRSGIGLCRSKRGKWLRKGLDGVSWWIRGGRVKARE